MSNYLSVSDAFAKAIDRGITSYRSKELKALVTAISEYISNKTDLRIANVKAAWHEWEEKDPKEFANRGIALATDFEKELKAACDRLGVDFDVDDDDWEAPAIPKARSVVVNNHKYLKKGAKYTVSYGSSAAGAVQKGMALASGVGVKAALIGGAATLSATGIGGIAVGGVATVVSSGLAINAYRKTSNHVKNLMDLWNHRNSPELKRCDIQGTANPLVPGAGALDPAGHDIVANQVLPYIIKQKSRKMGRKKIAAVPMVGLVEGGRAVLHNLAKRWNKTQGKARLEHARWLANHFCEYDCEISRHIVAELYSVEEMYWLLDQDPEEAAVFLAEKMQST